MVTTAKAQGISVLALACAALIMVLMLAGGVEQGAGSGRDPVAGALDLRLFSPMPDDAQIGLARTVLQVSARRAGAAAVSAAVIDARRLAPLAGAVTLLLVTAWLHLVPQTSRPLLRGPPSA